MPIQSQRMTNIVLFMGLLLLFALAFTRVHMRVQLTLTGYRIGELKKSEHVLLKTRSELQMQLSKLTSRKHLELLASVNETVGARTGGLVLK